MQGKTNKPNNLFLTLILVTILSKSAIYQYLQIDGNGRFVTFLSIVSLFYGFTYPTFKRILLSTPVCLWAILCSYHLINCSFQGVDISEFNFNFIFIQEIAVFSITAYLFIEAKESFYRWIIGAFLFYCLTAYIYCEADDLSGRLTGFIYTTQLGQLCGITCLIISAYIISFKKGWIYYGLYIIPTVVMFAAGSRNGLISVFISFALLNFTYLRSLRIKKLLISIALLIVAWHYFQQTSLFDRLVNYETDELFVTNTILDSIFGDRAIYYYLGYLNFLDHPIFGLGLMEFANYNKFEYGMHSEIMVHLAEGGIIGFSLYFLLIAFLIKKLWKIRSFNQESFYIGSFMLLNLLLIGFTAREYQYIFFFPSYGIILGIIMKYNYKKIKA